MHPGGGMYDVLRLASPHGALIMLNRAGTVQVHQREGGQKAENFQPIEWAQVIDGDYTGIVETIEHGARLDAGAWRPMQTRDAVVATIAHLAALGAMSTPFTITQGITDSSDYVGPPKWWRDFTNLAPNETRPRPTDLMGEPGYRFWRVERNDFNLTFHLTDGKVWALPPDDLDLLDPDEVEEARMYATEDLIPTDLHHHFGDRELLAGAHDTRHGLTWAQVDSEPHRHPTDPTLRFLAHAIELGTLRSPR